MKDKSTPGTKLIWDAPEPFPGYVKDPKSNGRVVYPVIVTNETPKNNYLKTECMHIRTMYGGSWVSKTEEYLRFPTEEELQSYQWPEEKVLWNSNLKNF